MNKLHYIALANAFSISSIVADAPVVTVEKIVTSLYNVGFSFSYDSTASHVTLAQLYQDAYQILLNNYRCEYVYKNSIAKQLLLGYHEMSEAKLFSEFRIDKARVDALVVNGTTTAYEIKTELDKTTRLDAQIASYSKCFDKVNIVTHHSLMSCISKLLPEHVGLICMDDSGELVVEKEAISNTINIDPKSVFCLFRRDEYIEVVESIIGYRPNMPNTEIYNYCKNIFSKLSSKEAHDSLVASLKKRKIQAYKSENIRNIPDSIIAPFLDKNLTSSQCLKLEEVLCTIVDFSL